MHSNLFVQKTLKAWETVVLFVAVLTIFGVSAQAQIANPPLLTTTNIQINGNFGSKTVAPINAYVAGTITYMSGHSAVYGLNGIVVVTVPNKTGGSTTYNARFYNGSLVHSGTARHLTLYLYGYSDWSRLPQYYRLFVITATIPDKTTVKPTLGFTVYNANLNKPLVQGTCAYSTSVELTMESGLCSLPQSVMPL
jgi:hypothetical protein